MKTGNSVAEKASNGQQKLQARGHEKTGKGVKKTGGGSKKTGKEVEKNRQKERTKNRQGGAKKTGNWLQRKTVKCVQEIPTRGSK
jgi:hypothetical protein